MINILVAFTTLFVLLKIFVYTDWSWWLVLIPVYGPVLITGAYTCFIMAVTRKVERPKGRFF